VGAIDGQCHRIDRPFLHAPRPHDNLAAANAADQDNLTRNNSVRFGKLLQTLRQPVAVFEPDYKNSA
jgi:hypothetical protein